MSSGVPNMVFDGSSVPVEHRFEFMHEGNAALFDTAPLDDVDTFHLGLHDYLVDDLVVSRLEYDPQTLRRTPSHLDDSTSEWVTVQVYLQGNLTGRAGDRPLDLGPERVGIVDLSEPFAAWGGRTDAIWVGIPRARLAHIDDRYGNHPVRSMHRSSPRGMVLGAAVERLWRQLQTAAAAEAPDLAAGIVETVDIALRTERYTPTDRDVATAMEHYIAAHLDDLDLNADRLQLAFHCSRSALYRYFERHGGVSAYIREQRLVRCFEELSRPSDPPTPVWTVATRWGFENPSHFHRLFTRLFGLSPSALAHRGVFEPAGFEPGADLAADVRRFQRWARI